MSEKIMENPYGRSSELEGKKKKINQNPTKPTHNGRVPEIGNS